jgi:DNA-binding response OmpR family regulator
MKKHVLVIDDDPVLLAMVSDFLVAAGFTVSTADCGIYSNNIIYGRKPPDLIVLDVIMPLMSGVKKAKLLKQRDKSAHIPIILMSSKEAHELKSLAEEAGVNDYLCKPFTAEQLVAKVKKLLV